MATKATYLMEQFWSHQRARGDKPAPIYAMVSEGVVQPVGCIQGWSVRKGDVELMIKATAGRWRIERLEAGRA